ncbi:MAG: cation:dicarboxylate symporter family transporter [Brevinemataceae bacterium]
MFQSSLFTNFLKISEPMTVLALILLVLSFSIIKMTEKKKIDFSIRMMIGLVLGLGLGFVIQAIAGFPDKETIMSETWIQQTKAWYGLFGKAFVSFIRMLVMPIIMVSMIRVILTLKSDFDIKKLVGKTLFWLLFTTGISAIVGITLSLSANLGSDITVAQQHSRSAREMTNIISVLLNLIPANPIKAMAEDNVVGVVIFASLIGSSARIMRTKEKYQAIINLFAELIEASYRIIMSMAMTIIKFMPYAVIALMSETLVSYGLSAIKEAFLFIVLIYTSSAVMIVIYIILIAIHGLNPVIFLKKSMSAWLMAFSSRSSVGSLPVTISTLEKRLGVNSSTANFVASLGSTAGMNGCAGYFPAMVAISVAVMTNTPIDASFLIMVVCIAILGSLGIAGIPGSATMAASIMLSGIGLSQYFYLLAVVLAIDPIIDMARTMINVAGAMTSAVCIDKEMGTLNISTYNSSETDEIENDK